MDVYTCCRLEQPYGGMVVSGLPFFCLERWQSLHETRVEVLLSESGVHPLSLRELEELGAAVDRGLELGYGWTAGSPRLRRAIASLYNAPIGEGNVLVTNGSAEANLVTTLSIVEPGDTVLVDMPSYMQVRGLLEFRGARVVEVWRRPGEGWRLPVEEYAKLIEAHRPKAVFVNNPNNPTGSRARRGELEKLSSAAAEHGAMLVFDEVYRGLEHDGARTPSIVEVAGLDNAVAVGGLSKVYGLPGLRIGWIVASEKIVERAWAVKDYTSIAPSILSDHIAGQLLSNPSNVEALEARARRIVAENLETLGEVISEFPGLLEIVRPEAGAYTLARTPWTRDTMSLAQRLVEDYSILVVPGECFGLPGYLRIGLGSRPETFRRQAKRLVEALANLKG